MGRSVLLCVALVGLILAMTPLSVGAHPHMFLDSRIAFAFDGPSLTGFWLEWTFDPVFTEAILVDHDLNRDRRLGPEEVRTVEDGAFSNLMHYGYFTHIEWRGERSNPVDALEFVAIIINNRLVYRFFVPFALEATLGEEIVTVAVYDETFFCDCRVPEDDAVTLEGATSITVSHQVHQNKTRVITYNPSDGTLATNLGARNPERYSGMAHPTEVELTFSPQEKR